MPEHLQIPKLVKFANLPTIWYKKKVGVQVSAALVHSLGSAVSAARGVEGVEPVDGGDAPSIQP